MKLKQKIDAKIDQNEIESDCIWYLHPSQQELILYRIHLPTLTIGYFKAFQDDRCSIQLLRALPKNQIYGTFSSSDADSFQFISNQNFKIKSISSPILSPLANRLITCCFYDDSIFIYELLQCYTSAALNRRYERYLIAQNRWILLPLMPVSNRPSSCSGINKKILIVGHNPELLVYDLILDSYSIFLPIGIQSKNGRKLLIKIEGKMYMMMFSEIIEVYYCYDPLSEWFFCFKSDKGELWNMFNNSYSSRAVYEGFIYHIKDNYMYKFDLAQLKSERVEKFNLELGAIARLFN